MSTVASTAFERAFADLVDDIQSIAPDVVGHWETARRGLVVTEFLLPRQEAIPFGVLLQLQDDAVCLGVGESLWIEYFPLSAPATWNSIRAAAAGILRGECRVVEHFRNGVYIGADLEEREGKTWRGLACSTKLHLPGGQRTTRVLLRSPTTRTGRR